jgi:CRISPR-associated protein, Csm1 family
VPSLHACRSTLEDPPEGAARTLRGRSFYVQLLTEGVADFILRRLGLPPTNLIYAGGGNFYLLAGVSQQERLKGVPSSNS